MNKNKNIILSRKYKYKFKFIIVFITAYIFLYFLKSSYNFKQINNIKIVNSDSYNYKGEKILKSKLINKYLSNISDDYKFDVDAERKRCNNYNNLFDYSNESYIKSFLREKLLQKISYFKKANITHLDTIYLSFNFNFGNNLIIFNNVLFYCEIIGCNYIILKRSKHLHRKWLLKNRIVIKKLNITIFQSLPVKCKNNNILCLYESSINLFNPILIMPQVRIHLLI